MNIQASVKSQRPTASLAALDLAVPQRPNPADRWVLATLDLFTGRLLQMPQAPPDATPLEPIPCSSDAPRKTLLCPQGSRIEGNTQLGIGGCGAVLLATVTGLHGRRLVALKESRVERFSRVRGATLGPREALARARREFDIMRASGSCLSPTELYHCRRTRYSYGSLYAVMPAMRADAVDVTNALRRWAPEVRNLWARSVMDALIRRLTTMHARGFLHADVKPENILLDFDGIAHLSDYGLAARIEEPQVCRGSLEYAAPEQITFASKPADQFDDRADVYAAAVTVLALLADNPLRTEDSMLSEWDALQLRRDLHGWQQEEVAGAHAEVTGRRAGCRRRIAQALQHARHVAPTLFPLLVSMLAYRRAERPRMAQVQEAFHAQQLGLSHSEQLELHKALLKLPIFPQARAIAHTLRNKSAL